MNRACPTLALLATAASAAAQTPDARPLPYWATIVAGEARMRTGPGRQFPAIWLYRRPGLPVQVVQVAPGWRRVRDQDGALGWMLVTLLSDSRHGVVTGGTRDIRTAPSPTAPVRWQAEPGVIGTLSRCASGWCRFETKGRAGYVEAAHLWGVTQGETLD